MVEENIDQEFCEEFPTKAEANGGRTRQFRRKERRNHIARKQHIIRSYCADNMPSEIDSKTNHRQAVWDLLFGKGRRGRLEYGDCFGYWSYKYAGQLSKGKIHCSCMLCSFHGPTMQDIRNIEGLEARISDALEDGIESEAVSTAETRLKRDKSDKAGFNGFGMCGTSFGKDENHIEYMDWQVRQMIQAGSHAFRKTLDEYWHEPDASKKADTAKQNAEQNYIKTHNIKEHDLIDLYWDIEKKNANNRYLNRIAKTLQEYF